MAARKRDSVKPQPELKKAYRVCRNSCFHAGIEYSVGDILPDLPLPALNVHLPNLELVEVEEVLAFDPDPEPSPETAIAIIDQVEADGGSDYDVQL